MLSGQEPEGILGKNIDFEINSELSTEQIKSRQGDTPVGAFQIDDKNFDVTLAEIDRIIETAQSAKSTFLKSYSMGRYGN